MHIVISKNYTVLFCIFDHINVALVSLRHLFQKHKKILFTPNF